MDRIVQTAELRALIRLIQDLTYRVERLLDVPVEVDEEQYRSTAAKDAEVPY